MPPVSLDAYSYPNQKTTQQTAPLKSHLLSSFCEKYKLEQVTCPLVPGFTFSKIRSVLSWTNLGSLNLQISVLCLLSNWISTNIFCWKSLRFTLLWMKSCLLISDLSLNPRHVFMNSIYLLLCVNFSFTINIKVYQELPLTLQVMPWSNWQPLE